MTEAISRLWTTDNIGLMHQFLVPASGLTNPDKLFFQHMIILTKIQFNFCKKYSACLMLDVLLMPIFLPIFCFSLTIELVAYENELLENVQFSITESVDLYE